MTNLPKKHVFCNFLAVKTKLWATLKGRREGRLECKPRAQFSTDSRVEVLTATALSPQRTTGLKHKHLF